METDLDLTLLDMVHEAICELAIKKTLTKSAIQTALEAAGIEMTLDHYMQHLVSFAMFQEKPKRVAIKDFVVNNFLEWITNDDAIKATTGVFLLEGLVDIGMNKATNIVSESWIRHVHLTALSDDAVLILGETGTSKQAMAQSIHTLSSRRQNRFESINCAALPEDLLEGELFGFEKGAFTGATAKKDGRLTMAQGGTVFLDELGKMPVPLQGKILKALEDKQVFPLGAKEPVQINCRFVAAIQPADMDARKDARKLLPDLLYRFGWPDVVRMPTLRERLAKHSEYVPRISFFKAKTRMNMQKEIGFHDGVYELLQNRDFAGNFRELENILCYGIKMMRIAKREVLLPEDIAPMLQQEQKASGEPVKADALAYVDDIPLKDIVGHAEAAAQKLKESIVRRKLEQVKASGQTVFGLLEKEGVEKQARQSIYKKIKNITGNLRDRRI